jgi:hypothetical protein
VQESGSAIAVKGSTESDNGENEKSGGSFRVEQFMMDDLSQHQRQIIVKQAGSLKYPFLKLNLAGLDPTSNPLLENIEKILKENPDIRVEMIVHSDGVLVAPGKIEVSESLAQELAFHFRNAHLGPDRFKSYSVSSDNFLSKTNLRSDHNNKVVELVFMK